MNDDIKKYNNAQPASDRLICNFLYKEINAVLTETEHKIWHGHPVWFIDGNPVVGYSKLKGCVRLLFWSGRTFDEKDLKPEGSFKAAEKRYISVDQIHVQELHRWLKKARDIQWDYKNIVKRRGELIRIK